MLSCIGKGSSSKDRNNQNQISKNDKDMKKFESENKDDHNNQKKKKQSLSVINELVLHFNISPNINQLNQSYSPIDYCPMMSDNLHENFNNEESSTNQESLSNCYLNPTTDIETNSDINYMQTKVIQSLVMKYPVAINQKDSAKTNNKQSSSSTNSHSDSYFSFGDKKQN
ncbi:unnamed protein product [Rotaria sp. Silwood1]|nr:unnamed protein product [Rotaria sp. Silwood1]